ncbi:hypothetical protein PC117_g12488 [Phytophthora cactorum]|uniref:Ubiquitin carboxyl-terminal hydrolase n=2 Tax=Phytophthora cactorum TaxID=29920 RepID=A0A8T1D7C2_9STRA|nr:hypothetical protein PC117_g12488 [Phytophthora cactorum]
MPLSIWILASFQYGMNQESYRYAANLSSNIQLHGNQQNLNGFWLRISVTITSRDGFERAAVFPQVIAFKHCTFQSVIDAILFQKNWCGYGNDTSSNVITMCQCQALIAERNAAGEIKTVAMQDEPKTLQQDQLATSLGSILPFNCASEALQCTIDHRKIAFELLFSVVEVEESTEGGGTQSRNEESLVPVVDVGKVIEPLVYQQMPRTIAKIPRGLTNLGNTCFMNAVLQSMAVTPMLNTQICQKEIHSEQLSSPTPREKPIQPFSETLGELFAEMSRSKQDTNTTISPKNLLKAFSVLSPDMADGNQQDAQEFLVCLLGHLSNRLTRESKTSDESLILSPRSHAWLSNLFQRNDNGVHGKIAVPFCAEDSNGRHDRLVATECTEHLDASCSHCQQECSPHTKQLSLWSLPPILVLQLKRFELSITTGNYQWKKLSHNVDFPVYGLDLHDLLASIDGAHNDSEVCSDRCSVDALDPRVCRGIEYLQNELNIPLTSASRTCAKYDLYAVVHHSGHGIGSGHYTAQFRRPDENYWWNADDAVVTPLNEDDISPSSAAYLLFYVRQDVAAGVTGLSDLFPPQM